MGVDRSIDRLATDGAAATSFLTGSDVRFCSCATGGGGLTVGEKILKG
ncbi:MAG: hypothetical protein ABW168_08200 [Sedimenticola sp.]